MDNLDVSVLRSYHQPNMKKLDEQLKKALGGFDKKIVTLDDDPTGVQTVNHISVYTTWDEAALAAGFAEEKSLFFVMTNSRGMTNDKTIKTHRDIAASLSRVVNATGQDYVLISRSDSTLRGHFPLETDTLRRCIEGASDQRFDGEIIAPFFREGGRYTIGNVHYVHEGRNLVPVGQTEFARDKSFGYKSSDLGDYVEEKTNGQYKKKDCIYIALENLRSGNIEAITAQLMRVQGFGKVILNAIDYCDVKVFVLAYIDAVKRGKRFLFRSAAAIPKVLGGISDQPLLDKSQLIDPANRNGGIVVVGSHVNKTTRQLDTLRTARASMDFIEFDQHLVLNAGGLANEVARVSALADAAVKSGRNITIYTRRERFDLDIADKDAQLRISTHISDAVTSVIGNLTVRPNFIIAKGGITSSDVGTKALRVKRAEVMGQVKPGIPVWMTGPESKFPQMPYVIFPGNVGDEDTLKEIVDLLS
ncbi:hydroxyacid dehydrogenase [Ruminococcaceae bacterium OttesenSCG-928-A11]|nr:hydroxyacid dehydrogenase [Ruminococcaceae bacterium OttesenSCG-928-A11]